MKRAASPSFTKQPQRGDPSAGVPIPDGESIVSGSLATCGPFTAYATAAADGTPLSLFLCHPAGARAVALGPLAERGVTVDVRSLRARAGVLTAIARIDLAAARDSPLLRWDPKALADAERPSNAKADARDSAVLLEWSAHGDNDAPATVALWLDPGRAAACKRARTDPAGARFLRDLGGNALALVCRDERGLDSLYVSDGATATFRHVGIARRAWTEGQNLFPVETGWFGYEPSMGWRVLFVYPTGKFAFVEIGVMRPVAAVWPLGGPMYACRCTDGTLISLEDEAHGASRRRASLLRARPMAPPAAVA
eukprot:tig00020539_g10410.t1